MRWVSFGVYVSVQYVKLKNALVLITIINVLSIINDDCDDA